MMAEHMQIAAVEYAGHSDKQRLFFEKHEIYLADMGLDITDYDKNLAVFNLPDMSLHITKPLFKFSHLQAYFLPCKLIVEGMAIYGFIYTTHVKIALQSVELLLPPLNIKHPEHTITLVVNDQRGFFCKA